MAAADTGIARSRASPGSGWPSGEVEDALAAEDDERAAKVQPELDALVT